MLRYSLRRVAQAILLLIPTSMIVFAILQAAPGDPATFLAGPDPQPGTVEALRQEFGLDRSIWIQYGAWASHAVRGDLGRSLVSGLPVWQMVLDHAPATIQLALAAGLFAVVWAIPTGVIAARYSGRGPDWLITIGNSVLFSTPTFWLGILGILLFSLKLRWLPVGGSVPFTANPVEALRHLVLPTLALGLPTGAVLSRFVKAAVVEQLAEDYTRASRARGLSMRAVVVRHALRNALVPIVTVFGVQLAYLLGGAVVVESVFSWPGLGVQTIDAIQARDYAVVQASLLVLVVLAVGVNLIVDLTYGYFDPRIRVGDQGNST